MINPQLIHALYKHNWVVYAKRPFTGPQSVVEYLGRYTHKIAISNHRLKHIDDKDVTFTYKDYKHGSVNKQMTLDALEFIRRYSLHILPKAFVRIRHYGILSSTCKKQTAICIKQQVAMQQPLTIVRPVLQPYNPLQCPCCKKETMHTLMHFNQRGPPQQCLQVAADLLYALI